MAAHSSHFQTFRPVGSLLEDVIFTSSKIARSLRCGYRRDIRLVSGRYTEYRAGPMRPVTWTRVSSRTRFVFD